MAAAIGGCRSIDGRQWSCACSSVQLCAPEMLMRVRRQHARSVSVKTWWWWWCCWLVLLLLLLFQLLLLYVGSTGGFIERQVGRGSTSFWLSCCWFPELGTEAPCAGQERKVEEGRAAVPRRGEKRGLAKSLMRTGRPCAVMWYGHSVSSPRCRSMSRPRRGT